MESPLATYDIVLLCNKNHEHVITRVNRAADVIHVKSTAQLTGVIVSTRIYNIDHKSQINAWGQYFTIMSPTQTAIYKIDIVSLK